MEFGTLGVEMGYLNQITHGYKGQKYLPFMDWMCLVCSQHVDTVCPFSKCLAQDTDWAEQQYGDIGPVSLHTESIWAVWL